MSAPVPPSPAPQEGGKGVPKSMSDLLPQLAKDGALEAVPDYPTEVVIKKLGQFESGGRMYPGFKVPGVEAPPVVFTDETTNKQLFEQIRDQFKDGLKVELEWKPTTDEKGAITGGEVAKVKYLEKQEVIEHTDMPAEQISHLTDAAKKAHKAYEKHKVYQADTDTWAVTTGPGLEAQAPFVWSDYEFHRDHYKILYSTDPADHDFPDEVSYSYKSKPEDIGESPG